MKSIFFPATAVAVALLIAVPLVKSVGQNTWVGVEGLGSMSSHRTYAVGFSISDKGYIGTGFGDLLQSDLWEYNVSSDNWTQKASMGGGGRQKAVGFSIGNKGYIGLGEGTLSSRFKDFWEYDPANNTWTQKTDFGGASRAAAVGFSINGKGYVGTGDLGVSPFVTKDFWEYDPVNDDWTQKTDFGGTSRGAAVGFSIGNKGYIGTGNNEKDFWEYDPVNDDWTQKTDFGGYGRAYAVGFSIGNKGYIGTGYSISFGNYYKDFWEWNQSTNGWTQKADFANGMLRGFATGFSIGDKGYIGTGKDGNLTWRDIWSYTQEQDTVGIKTIYIHTNIDIYPNPVTHKIIIAFSNSTKENINHTLTIYNLTGEKIHKSGIFNLKSEIDVSSLSQGIYFIEIKDNEGTFLKTQKFIKQ